MNRTTKALARLGTLAILAGTALSAPFAIGTASAAGPITFTVVSTIGTGDGANTVSQTVAGLAPRLISDLLSRIRLLVDRGLPVLLVEQNVKAALKVVDHLYLLERGRIVGEGPAETMAADHRIVEAYLGTIAAGART